MLFYFGVFQRMDHYDLTAYSSLEHCKDYVHVKLTKPCPVLSSALYNGGALYADHIINLKVDDAKKNNIEQVDYTEKAIAEYCKRLNWCGITVGMMTAAPMKSLRVLQQHKQGVSIVVMVTSGLANARRAGDPAEWRLMGAKTHEVGTINTIILTTAKLTHAAMVEVVMVTTEAKVAALQNMHVQSPISHELATGTGTDSIVVVGNDEGKAVDYCGKHVIFGEILATLVIRGMTASLSER